MEDPYVRKVVTFGQGSRGTYNICALSLIFVLALCLPWKSKLLHACRKLFENYFGEFHDHFR